MSNRLDQERQILLEPERMQYCRKKLLEIGILPINIDNTELQFEYKGNKVRLFPYSGWYQGKGVIAGRGIHNLLKQLNHLK